MRLTSSSQIHHLVTPGDRKPSHRSGFTLIELMIVLAILAIITAVAYPNYIDQIRKSRRADAISTLMDRAQLLERCFTRFNAYDVDDCPDPAGPSADGFYQIASTRTTTTYTLTATPNGDQALDRCAVMTLDYLGNKTPAPGNNRCWGSS